MKCYYVFEYYTTTKAVVSNNFEILDSFDIIGQNLFPTLCSKLPLYRNLRDPCFHFDISGIQYRRSSIKVYSNFNTVCSPE